MIINDAGTYTLKYTATDSCGKSTTVDREVVVAEPTLFGIRSFNDSSSACERIDDSADFVDPIPQRSDGNGGWIGGSSPFDKYMPWKGIEVVEDANAGTLVKIPKYWYKWTRSGVNEELMQLEISSEAREGFFVSPAHAYRSSTFLECDYVYVGRYHCSSGFKSQTGVVPLSNETIATFRNGIHGLGTDIWQWDFATYWTIAMLYLVEFADWDSQKMIGGGCSNGEAKENTGLTDSMTYHTGTTNTQAGAENYGHIQYRHIEDLWANVCDWCDGVRFNNGSSTVHVNKIPSTFGNLGTQVGSRGTTSGYPKLFTNPSAINGYEFALYPKVVADDINGSRTHDSCAYGANSDALFVGGNYFQRQYNGLFYFGGNYSLQNKSNQIGSRLMKLPS